MATTKATSGKATTDSKGNALYLQVTETREHGYFHLRARVCTQRYEAQEVSGWTPHGVDDDYSDGLLWSGLLCSCQGDERSQLRAAGNGESGPVYGFGTEYASDYHRIDLRRVKRMHKTLAKISAGMDKLQEARGYVRSYGEYLGRVAEVLGCAGMCFERNAKSANVSGQRYEWLTVGEGVNRANHAIYLWQQLAVREPLQLQAGEEVAS